MVENNANNAKKNLFQIFFQFLRIVLMDNNKSINSLI